MMNRLLGVSISEIIPEIKKTPMKETDYMINLRMPDDIARYVKFCAREGDVSRSQVIRDFIEFSAFLDNSGLKEVIIEDMREIMKSNVTKYRATVAKGSKKLRDKK